MGQGRGGHRFSSAGSPSRPQDSPLYRFVTRPPSAPPSEVDGAESGRERQE